MQPTRKTYTLEEAIKKLEHFCAYQERCHKEVAQKLRDMFMIPEAVNVVLVHLIEHNFLNETRYAQAFVSGKFKIKHWGKRKLAFHLQQKDISKANITQALASISDADYLELFNTITAQKVATIRESNILKKKKKFVDYFLYRGWESHLVYERANELMK